MSTNQKLSCLIIEDEPIAAEILEDYIQQIAFLDWKATCKDALFGLDVLQNQAIDVLFLDIHLPKLKGLDFLRSLNRKPQTILTTAFHQYAIEAFEENVVDYLMKPISFPRFLKAVNKLKQPNTIPIDTGSNTRGFKFFNSNKKKVKVYFDEILYIESLKDYVRLVMLDSNLVIRAQIGAMEAMFKEPSFLRIHRSYMIALDKISSYSATSVQIGTKELPIGRNYRTIAKQRLDRLSG